MKTLLFKSIDILNIVVVKWICRGSAKSAHALLAALLGTQMWLWLTVLENEFVAFGLNFLISSVLFLGKEFVDAIKPNPTGFDKSDLAIDYISWFTGTVLISLIWEIVEFYSRM